MKRRVVRAAAIAAAVGCFGPAVAAAQRGAVGLDSVLQLGRARDYFTLRELAQAGRLAPGAGPVARAVLGHAFNDPAGSNRAIAVARAGRRLSDSLALALGQMEAANLLRLGRYRDGLALVRSILRRPPGGGAGHEIDDLANTGKIFAALADAGPQTVVRRGATELTVENGLIPVRVGAKERRYVFDTGAGLSTMARSEAATLGLRVIPAGIDVGSSTDVRNSADLAVAPEVRIGGLLFRNVVFLVFDDRLLTFPGFTITGIIGFPVIEAMGEVRVFRGGRIEVPAVIPRRPVRNMALDGLVPLTTVTVRGDRQVCRLDTGATDTDFYLPFYRHFRGWIDSVGVADSTETGGVGGVRKLPVRRMPAIDGAVGDTVFRWERIGVMTTSIVKAGATEFLACNVGHDALDRFESYLFNFREMSFLLR